jgi:PAS domain S-box-containing protein
MTSNALPTSSNWPPWAQYVLALGAVALGLGIRWLLDPLLGDAVPFITVFAALLVLVLIVRPGPFLVGTVLGVVGAVTLFINPRLDPITTSELLQIALFGLATAAGAFASWLSQRVQTRRQQAEDELMRRSEELRVITDAMPALISYVDTNLRYQFVNARYVEWFGRRSEEIVGQDLRSVLGDAAFERVKPHFEAALAGHRSTFEGEIPYESGTRYVRGEYVPNIGPDGRVIGFYALVSDVSEQRQAEVARAQLAAIVETSGDAIFSISPERTILTWNAGAERLFGYSAAEAVGRTIDLILPPEHADEERSKLERVWQGEPVGPSDTVRRTKDGRMIDVSVTVSPIRDASGRIVGASKLDRDITERKQAEATKDEFIATLAHELRNPLAAVYSATEVLGAPTTGEQLERITGIIRRQVSLMMRLLDDLLDVSRITRGTLELRSEHTSVLSLVHQALDAASPWIDRKGHSVKVEAAEGSLDVDGDPVRLVQVFTNMLNNACKYTNPRGHINVRIARDGDNAVVEIRDDGIGIPREKLDTIFEMFSQLGSPRRSEGGLGIGLALSRRLVEMHGGTMTADSQGPGQGSRFTVRLPAIHSAARERTSSTSIEARPEHARETRARRVLVVDDNVDAADTLASMLSSLGHTTRIAYDGSRALAEVSTFRPEVLLLDLGLPDIDGIQVCRAIRAKPWGKDVFVVALSGWGQARDRLRTAEAGFDAHLAKPAALDELSRLLANGPVTASN